MKYERVYIDAVECALPDEIVTSDELESRLAPLYDRLRLPYGRIELMTGVLERGLWARGALPGDQSVKTVDKLLRTAGVPREKMCPLFTGTDETVFKPVEMEEARSRWTSG